MSFTGAFGTLAFLNPWVLAGLIFLPALWFLLRVTPPAPRLVVFPAARFVAGLIPEEPTTSRTPWWILLLRLIILALIVIALARPVLNPNASLPGVNGIRIVVDNSWASAQTWEMQMEEAKRLASSAGRDGRDIYILTTAPEPGSKDPAYHGPLTRGQAEGILRGLAPRPWPADYEAARRVIMEATTSNSLQSYWLSHGLQEGGKDFAKTLQNQGGLQYIRPEDSRLPVLIRPTDKITRQLAVLVSAPKELPPGTPVTVNAIGANGRVLDTQKVEVDVREKSATVVFDIPDAVRNQIHQIRLAGRKGAGAVLLLDDQFKKRNVGIVSPTGDPEKAPLVEESFYLERALEPYANLTTGTAAEVLEGEPAAIILPNIGAMPPADLNALEEWVRAGGLLLRFAGPNMTQGENFLVPVPLMQGGRALQGAMTWEEPVKLAPFPQSSPLYGLSVPEDIEVRQQLLAQPVEGLEEKTWAALDDGTPLITANNLDSGLIVLVHTTATPLWSDLSLSGLFVQLLRRVISLAGNTEPQSATSGMLQPLLIMDGYGVTMQPESFVQPIASENFEQTVPSAVNPPGIYGRAGYQTSLNLGDRIGALRTFSTLPLSVETGQYGKQNETSLLPWILAAAFGLFMLDWVIMALMQMNWQKFRPARAAAHIVLCASLTGFSLSAQAQTEQQMIDYAANIHLAYVRTGNAAVDRAASAGLEALADVLTHRTSVEPSGVVAIDPEQELSFFPVIYWPVTQEQQPLSTEALQNIQYYIDHGGTILFDTRDHVSSVNSGYGQSGRNAGKLRELTANLDIPPLIPVEEGHVLSKSFYLLDDFSGRYIGGTLWVEQQSLSGRDGVSSVIVGSNDWASAWASATSAGPRLKGGPQQQEEALRFGVNLVMYALTGNYKADQVHLPHILERLGQ